MLKQLFVVIAVAIAACQPQPPTATEPGPQMSTRSFKPSLVPLTDSPAVSTPPPENTPEPANPDNRVEFSLGEISFSVRKPPDWEADYVAKGVMLAEHPGSLTKGDHLDGIQMYIFVTSLAAYNLPDANPADGTNIAWSVLHKVSQTADHIIAGDLSRAVAFEWHPAENPTEPGYDAAYYLVNDGDGPQSIVIAVVPPDTAELLVIYLSAPSQYACQLRAALLQLLEGLMINGVLMDITALDVLPKPLIFPKSNPLDEIELQLGS